VEGIAEAINTLDGLDETLGNGALPLHRVFRVILGNQSLSNGERLLLGHDQVSSIVVGNLDHGTRELQWLPYERQDERRGESNGAGTREDTYVEGDAAPDLDFTL
jgi:hypothetical protein